MQQEILILNMNWKLRKGKNKAYFDILHKILIFYFKYWIDLDLFK